ncbi:MULTISPECIES: peptidoglycan D,D-transpeptidase FtsI family protein [Microbacterium]|uniref:Penicillin-binding protein 2 n=1 Tax=Microbacterium wangchenii TaxID=2541726 RepID=A0ABX5SQM8_9MICO|nr:MULTISPECIES: penicillin-binding protein 2 [Microbacterium]MCK6064981.1 penicillin-binding protein 2 [Microbacterium sp. EYE_512]QBR88454.1 penicillin-binding protein 2 [Microbacterium wangchenii]TFV82493.1 penicillin-binding protein 2 [Microbacterium sp. dk485]TXK20181.1 penicillin-binding protein 2 [Microbacterium wangchenii]
MTTRSTRSPRRRTVVALAVVLAVLVGFVVRLVDIQVVNAGEHIEDSLSLGFAAERTLYGTRGTIVDEQGATLAGSILLYDAQLDPSNVNGIRREGPDGERIEVSWPELAAEIAAITGQTPQEVQQVVEDAKANDPDSQYALLKRGLTTEQYRSLVALGIPFLYFDQHPSRMYPDGAVGGNLVGFVGTDGKPLAGIEQAEDDCLTATDGKLLFQRGKDGVTIPGTAVEDPAVDGGTLQLTINRDLQWYLQQLAAEQAQNTGAKSATITVVEVETGKVRGMAEYPTVDPNNVDGSHPDDRGSRIFTNTFEPGSTFKALTAAIAIDAGGANPGSTVTADWKESFPNGARVRDPFVHPVNNYTLTGVLVDSSNVGISKFGDTVSAQTRYDYLQRFGVGVDTPIDFQGEEPGVLRPIDQWDNQTFYNVNFGQGLTTTVPQLVGAYQTLANDGTRMPLSLVEGCTRPDGTVTDVPDATGQQVVSEKAADEVSLMLENVATQGTLAKQVEIPGYRVAIKTGTGEKSDGAGGYKAGAYFTTMIGYAPADDPKFVVAVTLDEPATVKSSAANAPAFQKAMTQVLKTYRVMPSGSATPELPKFG